jgi:hypothetical protein
MNGLKAKLRAGAPPQEPTGFRLETPTLLHFSDCGSFGKAISEQKEHLAMVDATYLNEIDLDGSIKGTDWKLSHAAFSDLCHLCTKPVPVSFIKNLAKINDSLALEVIEEVLRVLFHRGQEKQLVIDTRNNRVEGIVGKESYSPISHSDVIEFAFSANPALSFTNGWLSGPIMRMTATTKEKPAEPKPGDVTLFGVNIENAIHGDRSVKIADYAERLKCTNGMVARECGYSTRVRHVGDVDFNVQRAVLASATKSEELAKFIDYSAARVLDENEVENIMRYLADPKNGGGPKFEAVVRDIAVEEASGEGRPEGEITLYNFVNGVTQAAHTAKNLQRKTEIEAMGYTTLVRFGIALSN